MNRLLLSYCSWTGLGVQQSPRAPGEPAVGQTPWGPAPEGGGRAPGEGEERQGGAAEGGARTRGMLGTGRGRVWQRVRSCSVGDEDMWMYLFCNRVVRVSRPACSYDLGLPKFLAYGSTKVKKKQGKNTIILIFLDMFCGSFVFQSRICPVLGGTCVSLATSCCHSVGSVLRFV